MSRDKIRLGDWTLASFAIAMLAVAPAFAAKKKAPADGVAPAPVPADLTHQLGAVKGWSAYLYREKSGRVCYLVGRPERTEPVGAKRRGPTAMVTHRPEEKIANVVSFVEGYNLKDGSDVALDVGGTKFELFTKGDSAWARSAELDKTIVDALAHGKEAIVKGTPQKGSPTTDTYSLAGFAQALALIDKACGVKR